MEAAPASPFEMGEAEFAFEFLVVALDAPAQFGRVDENVDGRVFGQGRKPVFGRLFFALGPFAEKPFQRMGRRNLPVPRSRPNPHGREARRQDFVRALPPWNDAPSLLGKPPRQCLGGNRDMFAVAPPRRENVTGSCRKAKWLAFGRIRRPACGMVAAIYSVCSRLR